MNGPPPPRRFRVPLWGYLALFVALTGFYLLGTSRERPWADATPLYQVAESIVFRGEVDIVTAWPPNLAPGRDGKIFATAPLFQSLVHVPGVWLRKWAQEKWPDLLPLLVPWSAHLAPAVLAALTCLIFLSMLSREGFRMATSVVSTLSLGLATTLWVYARQPYSEILQAFCVAGLFSQLWAFSRRQTLPRALCVAIWFGLLLNAKPLFGLIMPGLGLYVLWLMWRNWKALFVQATAFVLALVPFAYVITAYNEARFGGAASTGYGIGARIFAENPILGLWGLFLSPGKSILLYSPPLFIAVVGLTAFYRKARRAFFAGLVVLVPSLYVYSRFAFWSGDWAWGPRYIIPFIPIFLTPAAFVLEGLPDMASRVRRWLAGACIGAVLGAGVFVQVLGCALYWDHFIRISTEAGTNWLGRPNPTGAMSYMPGNCGACFEEMNFQQWLPPFQPIYGHYWLAKHVFAKHTYEQALVDVPWRRYTHLRPLAAGTYARARIDWWYRDFHDHHRDLGVRIIVWLSVTAGLGAVVFALALVLARLRARNGGGGA